MPIESQFSRDEANALLAIEIANGGELAMLGEVIGAYRQLTHTAPAPVEFSQALGLLVDARLIEFVAYRIGLTPNGRKLLRKAGMPFDISRPGKITALLRRIPDSDLGDGRDPAPSEDDIRAALIDRSYMGAMADEDEDEDFEDDDFEDDEELDDELEEDNELEDDEYFEGDDEDGEDEDSEDVEDNDEASGDEDDVDEAYEDGEDIGDVGDQPKSRFGGLFRRNR